MDFSELNEKMGRVFSHFRMKHPGQDTILAWLPDLEHIPDEAGKWITRKICNEADSMPRNIVKAFKDLWGAYKSENPDKIKRRETEFCTVCGDSGLIWFRYHVGGHRSPHESCVRCGHCENHAILGRPIDMPRMKAGEIKRSGCELHWRNNSRKTPEKVMRRHKSEEIGSLIKITGKDAA